MKERFCDGHLLYQRGGIVNARWLPILAAVAFAAAAAPAAAMPNFAQAYNLDCRSCHTEVPALNDYGRYVQRTQYAALEAATVQKAVPIWVGESASYDSSAGAPYKPKFGNLEVHGDGFLGNDLTFHIQQWLVQGDQPGGLDTAWISYNKLLKGDGHLVIGKMPVPGPSYFGFFSDLSAFAPPGATIGEHTLQLDANRWGAKFGYTPLNYVAEIGWYGSGSDLNGFTDFSSSVEKGVQWRVAYAHPKKPFEAGLYGNWGTFPLSTGDLDRYSATGAYLQRDPKWGVPGILATYQSGNDGNAGVDASANPLGAAHSTGYSLGLFRPVFNHWENMLSLRAEMLNDGLGTITHGGNIDYSFRIYKYLHAFAEAGLAQNSTPAWRYQLWWSTPVVYKVSP
jgi:hypothetical protein